MSASGQATEDIIEDIQAYGYTLDEATNLFEFMQEEQDYFSAPYNEVADGLFYEGVSDLFVDVIADELDDELDDFIPDDEGDPRMFNIGADWKGFGIIKERETENTYIPSSGYCYHKCVNKFLELEGIDFKLNYKGISPYECSKKKLDGNVKVQLKKFDVKIPDMYKVKYNPETGNVTKKSISNDKIVNPKYFIGLLHLGKNIYHAFLCKDKSCKLVKDDIRLERGVCRELNIDFTPNRKIPYKTPHRYVISYDIETYVKNETKNGKNVKRMYPMSLGWCVVDLQDEKVCSDYHEILVRKEQRAVIKLSQKEREYKITDDEYITVYNAKEVKDFLSKPKSDNPLAPYLVGNEFHVSKKLFPNAEIIEWVERDSNLYNEFFDQVFAYMKTNLKTLKTIQIFAHYGGKFDNIFARQTTKYTFKSIIRKGSFIKVLTVNDCTSKLTVDLKDTFPFCMMSLKQACATFKAPVQKISFDIKDKSYEWYMQNYGNKDPASDWAEYMKFDVISLAHVIINMEKSYSKFGASITNFTGLAGISYYLMDNYCYGMRSLDIPKDPSCVDFISKANYGGRVLCWKRFYNKLEGSKGLISIDMNSLYPSAMSEMGFPVGKPFLYKEDQLDDFNSKPHYIVNCSIKVPNVRYAYHPYKTTEGCLIYPSNTIIKGVYNDVDIREMMKDGYEVIAVEKGFYWNESKRIFTNFIRAIYDLRMDYKKLDTEDAEYVLQEVCKLIINSTYGKFNEVIKEVVTFFETELKAKKKNEKSVNCNLANGQCESQAKLLNKSVSKATHIAGYILAYARALVNEIIRTVGPENIYYSDTDSIYLKYETMVSCGLKDEVKGLCGYKNDYGEDSYITSAIFLDMKRYYLELYNEKSGVISFKAKFNGLSFKNVTTISNIMYKNSAMTYADLAFDDQMRVTKELYVAMLESYRVRSKNPYLESNVKRLGSSCEDYDLLDECKKFDKWITNDSDIKLRKLNSNEKDAFLKEENRKYKEWVKNNADITKVAMEKFIRNKVDVVICKADMNFQVDPDKRGQWLDNDEFYSLGCNIRLWNKQMRIGISAYNPGMCEGNIGAIRKENACKKLINFTVLNRDDKFKISGYRPLVYKQEENDVKARKSTKTIIKRGVYMKSSITPELHSVVFNFYHYEYKNREEILYREDDKDKKHVFYRINAIGRTSIFMPDDDMTVEESERFMLGVIAIKDTKDNLTRYGKNYITPEELESLERHVHKISA